MKNLLFLLVSIVICTTVSAHVNVNVKNVCDSIPMCSWNYMATAQANFDAFQGKKVILSVADSPSFDWHLNATYFETKNVLAFASGKNKIYHEVTVQDRHFGWELLIPLLVLVLPLSMFFFGIAFKTKKGGTPLIFLTMAIGPGLGIGLLENSWAYVFSCGYGFMAITMIIGSILGGILFEHENIAPPKPAV